MWQVRNLLCLEVWPVAGFGCFNLILAAREGKTYIILPFSFSDLFYSPEQLAKIASLALCQIYSVFVWHFNVFVYV